MSRDGKSNTTNYTYNSLNLIGTITDPTNQAITYKYDKEGRLIKETNRNGKSILTSYNRDSRITSKKVEGSTAEEYYYYNKDGSLLAAANENGIDVFEYTPDGYLKRKSRNGKTLLEYTYNKNGSITNLITMGKTTNYTYDTIGRLSTVSDSSTLLASYNYNVDGNISNINYGTGINITYGYDKDKNITTIQQKNPHGEIINNLFYTYDVRGNQLTKVENNETTNYTYDKINRLKTVVYPGAKTEIFTYDNANNRTRKEIGQDTTTYDYDTRNRLTRSTSNGIITTYNYDNNGNLLKETTGSQITAYTYDDFNRPIEVMQPNGTYQFNHYDAMGLRVGITENGVSHQFIFSGRNVVAEINSNNERITRYTRGNSLIATEDHRGIQSFYLHNAHGDVINLVNGNGEIQNAYKYDAFGNAINHAAKVNNRFLYAGEQFDKVTGQYYLRARYYDPEIGRFTQEDPYRGDGLNLYTYVHNNPIRYIDPSGNVTEDGNGGHYNHITNKIVDPKGDIVKNTTTKPITSSKCDTKGTGDGGTVIVSPYSAMIEAGIDPGYASRAMAGYNNAMSVYNNAPSMLRVTPGVGTGIDLYELATGENAFNGEELSTFDKAITVASLGVSVLPLVSKVLKYVDDMDIIFKNSDGVVDALKGGADNIASFQKYKQGLMAEDALSNSKVIIEGEKLWDKKAIQALTSDGSSINDWAKMSSKYSYETPYGKGQFHYYQNLKTGEINAFDAKFKLTNEKVIPVDTSLNFLK